MNPDAKAVWYFAYGSNMSTAKFTGSRGIVPLDSCRVRVPGWVLKMEIPGLPYSEPTFASIAPRSPKDADEALLPDVHGVAYLISAEDYRHVVASEGGGTAYQSIIVYGTPVGDVGKARTGDRVILRTLGTALRRRPCPSPSKRYMHIVLQGSKEAKLPDDYHNFLAGIGTYRPAETPWARIGASLFLTLFGPVMMLLEKLVVNDIQPDGSASGPVVLIVRLGMSLIWAVHDYLFAPLFGRGDGVLDQDSAITGGGLSARGWSNVESIMPKIKSQVEQRKTPNQANIDLSTAENWLLRDELIRICKESISEHLEPLNLSYPRGFSGSPEVLSALAHHLNTYFSPKTPVTEAHIAATPGAASAVDALLYNICSPGDGVLVPGPYWNGFDFIFRVRSCVEPVLVPLPSFEANFDSAVLLTSLEETWQCHQDSGKSRIGALMLTNPHNPLGVCYPRHVLEDCLKWCTRHGIHFISDEVYALSLFDNDGAERLPFVSVLSLDLDALGVDKDKVHMVWSMSKDFGVSGFRMGCAVTQNNPQMAVALALAANTQVSALSAIYTTALLRSERLPELIRLNSERLTSAYTTMTCFLKKCKIDYVPSDAGLWVLARVASSWSEEAKVVQRLKDAGVLVSSGQGYHGPESEAGWIRVGFSLGKTDLKEAIRRMECVFIHNNSVENGID